MPYARKLRRQNRKRFVIPVVTLNKKVLLGVFVLFVVTLIGFVVVSFRQMHFWNGEEKIGVAVPTSNGAAVLLFDPQYEEIITIYIPKSTEVEVARGLGIWKVENLWQLGQQEKVGGKLLSDTLMKYFRFPTIAWGDTLALGLASGDIKDLYKASFSLYNTNLSLPDKVAMAWFSFNVSNARRIEIHLEDTGYLKEATLADGTRGYKKQDPPPQRVLSLFADSQMAKSSYSVSVLNVTGNTQTAHDVGQIVEVLGAKIARVEDGEREDIDCIIKGRDQLLIRRVAALFDCSTETDLENSFDMEIILGSKFTKRF